MSKMTTLVLGSLLATQLFLGCQSEKIPDGVRADEYHYFLDWYKAVDQLDKNNQPVTPDTYKKLRDAHPDVVERNMYSKIQPKEQEIQKDLDIMTKDYVSVYRKKVGEFITDKDPYVFYQEQKDLVKNELGLQ